MQRRGVPVVEFRKGTNPADAGKVEFAGETHRLGFNLGDQRFQESPQVNPVAAPPVETAGTRSEVHGRGNRHAGNDGRVRGRFAKVFEGQVATEAEADERHLPINRGGVRDHAPEVARLATVVEPQEPVGLRAGSFWR